LSRTPQGRDPCEGGRHTEPAGREDGTSQPRAHRRRTAERRGHHQRARGRRSRRGRRGDVIRVMANGYHENAIRLEGDTMRKLLIVMAAGVLMSSTLVVAGQDAAKKTPYAGVKTREWTLQGSD